MEVHPATQAVEHAGNARAPILRVRDLATHFFTTSGVAKAVDGVSFEMSHGETLGIVGESGSGKSVMALSLMRLVPLPGRIVGGKVFLGERDLLSLSNGDMRAVRGRQISIVLQDPMTSLNPVWSIGTQLTETLGWHRRLRGKDALEAAVANLRKIRVSDPEARMKAYPHQLSGGMRQRVVGAIAISGHPQVLIADEPTTSLDVSVQAQYLKLLNDLQQELGLSILFITHDFGIVAKICSRVAVMYAGRIVEVAPTRELFATPRHPYTKALIASVPTLDRRVEQLESIPGQPPLATQWPTGCRFAPRCPLADNRCRAEYPPAVHVGDGHEASCWRPA